MIHFLYVTVIALALLNRSWFFAAAFAALYAWSLSLRRNGQ